MSTVKIHAVLNNGPTVYTTFEVPAHLLRSCKIDKYRKEISVLDLSISLLQELIDEEVRGNNPCASFIGNYEQAVNLLNITKTQYSKQAEVAINTNDKI